MAKTFSIYRSSAGSGKTRTLAKQYLKLALGFKSDYYRFILAVTFTNKASQEMKDRILAYLDDFAQGKSNELAAELKQELNLDDATFQSRSKDTQSAILHGYAQFAISTIDAFFQKVIRSFTRESGIVGDYRLEVEQDGILETVIDNLIDELGSNKELTDWVVDFAKENLENEKAWDVRFSLIEFAKEIFREEFKSIEDEVVATTTKPGFFRTLKSGLYATRNSFYTKVSEPAKDALSLIKSNGWTVDDFSYGKTSGLLTFFESFANERNIAKLRPPGSRLTTHFQLAENWANKKSPHAQSIYKAAIEKLLPALKEIISIYESDYKKAVSADLAVKNLYVFGLIADISRKLKEYKEENNVMLLADAPKFLNGVIQDSDTPFIYEKVGSFYRNYLIDEFQDTSGMQWKNFQPLITNSLDQGFTSLVVGDVKQAIYRWRGGDLSLLQQNILQDIGEKRSDIHELDRNFRSAAQIVNFNNEIFKTATNIVSLQTGRTIASEAYTDVAQQPARKEDGFVSVQFLQEQDEQKDLADNDQGEGKVTGIKWKELALDQLTETLEMLQLKGIPLKDIAILVRKNDDGQNIAGHLLQYKVSDKAKPGLKYDVVSNESLRIDGAASVNLLLGAMRYLLNPDDAIARAQLGYEFARIHEPERELPDVFFVTNQSIFENNLPERFAKEKPTLKKLALIELTETLVEIFGLGGINGELIYLQAFQDLVLDFHNRERNDLGAFLEWWEDNKHKKSVQIAGNVDAVQILTIHKSKGLQFPFVLIPFCAWGLDHDAWQAPNLWVKSEQHPFTDIGYLPVKYTKQLEESFFSDSYVDEKTRTYLDNVNLLYVALTRAERGLIVTAPSFELKGAKDSVAGLLYKSITQNPILKEHWDEAALRFQNGMVQSIENKSPIVEGVSLEKYNANTWRNKLVIKRSSENFFTTDQHAQLKKNFGTQIHTILSRIRYTSEVDSMLESIALEGLMTRGEIPVIKSDLDALFAIPLVADWFSNKWNIKTEVPIILPDGRENRIDRLLIHEKQAVVIDFKTGEKKKADQEQVLDYMSILRTMNYTVEGFVVYVRDKEIVEVKTGLKPKVIKKVIDKDQLTLGL